MKRVYHSTFKEGTVIEDKGSEYLVNFDSVGQKTVLKSECSDILHD